MYAWLEQIHNYAIMYIYTQQLIDKSLTYDAYRQGIRDMLALPPNDEAAEKMRPYILKNTALMDQYDQTYSISPILQTALETAPPTTWLTLTESWCGDAAFNVPMLAAIEKAMPGKITLRLLPRDNHLEVMDAHLTDGGRSIPKLIVLSGDLRNLGVWGPRPAGLQEQMAIWKNEGLVLAQLIPKIAEWYNTDATRSVQEELSILIKNYS